MRDVEEKPKKIRCMVRVVWDMESGGVSYIRDLTPLILDTPVEFGGRGRSYCPDELFLSAIGGCLLTTFLYFKRRLRLNIKGLQVSIYGSTDLIGPEGYRITGITAVIHVEVNVEEKEKTEECIELTREYCHLTRSLEHTIPIKIKHEIRTV